MAVLILPEFTIKVDAATLDDFPYKEYLLTDGGVYVVLISTEVIDVTVTSASDRVFNVNGGGLVELNVSTPYYYTPLTAKAYILLYNELTGWDVNQPTMSWDSSMLQDTYYLLYPMAGVESITETDLPELALNNLDDALNATTTTTTQVTEINQNITNVYNQYQEGTIDNSTLQQNIDIYITQLNDLNELDGNTLADLIAIQNSLTYAQTVQDVANKDAIINTQQANPDLLADLSSISSSCRSLVNDYIAGNASQSSTMNKFRTYISRINGLYAQYPNQADQQAINNSLDMLNGYMDAVANYGDVDNVISNNAQASEYEEKQYLNDLVEETTSSIQDMSAEQQFQTQERTAANNILNLIWDNEILKRLVPISAVFMVVCVVLGIRYKL